MAEADPGKEPKNFHLDVPVENRPFFVKGAGALDWGMQNRFSKVFLPESGRAVMLAIDHGYFQGPTTGLERVDVNIVPLLQYCDALMLTRGMVRTSIPPTFRRGIVLRASGGPSILKELSNEEIAVDIEDAVRLNVAALADLGNRHGIPVLAVTAVGKDMVRDAKYFALACRICAELGAHFVKTYYVPEGFETIAASCPVPLVMAGGKKLPEIEAMTMAYNAIDQGAAGVDMGRNIFQSDAPAAMLQAVRKVVHEKMKPKQALELYQSLKKEGR
jgi:putative autoinducer-2 (AI-2) aldolase